MNNFDEWVIDVMPWIKEVISDISMGIVGDIPEIIDRQARYTAYAGRLVEIYADANTYYKVALANAIMEASTKISPSLVARVAEAGIKNETKIYEIIHRLNTTISDQLMAIASRLKYETALLKGNVNFQEKVPPFAKGIY